MAVTAPPPRKYNPGFLTDDELVASFCVRTREFESIVEILRECTGSSNQHQIVIGPRGSGKTSLLLRVAAEVRWDAGLSATFFPVVFAEESYEVASAGEFWLECLARLADQAPQREDGADLRLTFEDLRAIRDDQTLAERCLAALLDFSDRYGRRLVLMVENLNMMFRDMANSWDAGWRLRKTLQTEPRIILLASATSRFDEIDRPEHAMYDLFRTLTLRPLDTSECAVLWEAVSGRRAPQDTIRSLEILTGGSPRLLAIVARFGGGLSFRELMADLLDLVDDHTEYFKSHLESLPPQERRVYLALADLWKPVFTKEIADRARLDTSKCSAQLTRLVERGAVLVAGGTIRRKQYYLSERLYNIYYLLRRNRGPNRLIEALIRFMASYYSSDELQEYIVRTRRDMRKFDPKNQYLAEQSIIQIKDYIYQLNYTDQSLVLPDESAATDDPQAVREAKILLDKAKAHFKKNALENALADCQSLVSRFGESETPDLLDMVAEALVKKGSILLQLNCLEDALAACDEVMRRSVESETHPPPEEIAKALINKGAILFHMGHLEEALAACDEVMRRSVESETKAPVFILERHEKKPPDVWRKVGTLPAESEKSIIPWSALALSNKGDILAGLDRPMKALDAWDRVERRFGDSQSPILREVVGSTLLKKANLDLKYKRYSEAIETVGRALKQYLTKSSANRWRGHLIRARANFKLTTLFDGEQDIKAMLTSLSELDSPPKEDLFDLTELSIDLGPERMRELIQASPAADLLLPLTTALEWELGLEPRVAREVEEVARDIRRDLAKLKEVRTDGAA